MANTYWDGGYFKRTLSNPRLHGSSHANLIALTPLCILPTMSYISMDYQYDADDSNGDTPLQSLFFVHFRALLLKRFLNCFQKFILLASAAAARAAGTGGLREQIVGSW